MNTKYGFVILLDALGTRTATLAEASRYLAQLSKIEEDIKESLKATLHRQPENEPRIFDKLSIRFFGDTILITYEIEDRSKESEYLSRVSFISRLFICRALEMGLLFRGSISIGEYVDKETVVLGPAVADAASWYEKLDMIGVIFTPYATMATKCIIDRWGINSYKSGIWAEELVLDRHPMKTEKEPKAELFALNWVSVIDVFTEENLCTWFYKTMRRFPIPPGTESKFSNTEAFFLKHYAIEAKRIEEAKKRNAEDKKEN